MGLLTTTIGSYPKPAWVAVADWFRGPSANQPLPTAAYDALLREGGPRIQELDRATGEAVREQVAAGIDVPTDGEIRRENYVHYHCRHLQGIDFARLTQRTMRAGTWTAAVPTIVAPIRPTAPFLTRDFEVAQSFTSRPVKITIPGPLTIADTLFDAHYRDGRRLGEALADALNREIRALSEAGCRWIQVDEPLLARYPDRGLAYGVEHLERCFHGVYAGVQRVVHVCCGYPDRLDNESYPKAKSDSYTQLAPALEEGAFDAVSIEYAHRPFDLRLLERFAKKRVALGVVAIARSRIEPPDEIADVLCAALAHVDAARLVAAPDCGLGMLPRAVARAKLVNLVDAARRVGGRAPGS